MFSVSLLSRRADGKLFRTVGPEVLFKTCVAMKFMDDDDDDDDVGP